MVNIDYLYNPEPVRKFFNTNLFSDRKLGFQIIENGTIFPQKNGLFNGKWSCLSGGIVDINGKFVKGTVAHHAVVPINPPPPQEQIQHSSETVVYLGSFYPVWGHAITDNLSRIWFLTSEIFKSEFKNCRQVYVAGERFLKSDNTDFKRLLKILDVNFNKFQQITQPTQFERIILPDRSFGKVVTNEYVETIDRVRHFALKNRAPTSNKKIYFFYGRGQVGEERLAEYFKSKGYEIITGEQRANHLDEELNLLINAESFISTIGSCGHNSVFLRDGTEAIFIPRVINSHTHTYQSAINQIRSLNANYIDSTFSIFSKDAADKAHCYIISEQLKRFFGDKWNGYEEEDFKIFLDYVKSPIRGMRTVLNYQVKNYGAVFTDFMEQLKQRKDLTKACDMPTGWETFRPLLNYQTHVHMKGWRDGWKGENKPSNPLDQKLDVLAIKVNFPNHKVYYSVYFSDEEGWSAEVQAPEMAGTVGVRKPIYGMTVRFDEAGAKEFDILYRMHKFDDTWTPWAKNGEALYSHGVKLNAIQIKLEPKT